MTDKILFLIRGLPGSGKTTMAKEIADEYFEADQYFMVGDTYKFDASKLKEAHEYCKFSCNAAMTRRVAKIAVSNTSTMAWETEEYVDMAKRHGYQVFSLVLENRHHGESVHKVPNKAIQAMKSRFEIKL